MSGVVLRCPNCGTTRATPGDCEACHEAAVRYFCSNHTPGRWLESGTCSQCGARFGEVRRPPAAQPPAPTRPRIPTRRAGPPAAPRPSPPITRRDPGPGPGDFEGRRDRGPEPVDETEAFGLDAGGTPAPRAPTWDDLLRAVARGRMAPREWPSEEMTRTRKGFGLGGCLVRAVLLLIFLFVMLTGGVFSMFGGF